MQKPDIRHRPRPGVFTFIGVEHRDPNNNNLITSFSPSAITLTLTNLNGFTLTRTYKPFAMKTALNGEQMVWPSLNLYQGSTAAISFTNDFSQNIACTNTVASINLTPRPNPPGGRLPGVFRRLVDQSGGYLPGLLPGRLG